MSEERAKSGEARHSIGVVADRTGLSVHQLRAWERRHDAVRPERTEGGHRLYSDEDLRRLELLAELTRRGRRIGQLADLPTGELTSLVERDRRSEGEQRAETGEGNGGAALEEARRQAMEAVEDFDLDRLETAVRRASLKHGLRAFVDGLVVPVLTEVGDRWHAGELGVAQEHMASGVFSRALQHMLEGTAADRDAPAIVVGTPRAHRHEIGAMVAAAVAGSEGWRVYYLGADLPAEEIADAAREVDARAVALSLVYAVNGASTGDELRRLRKELPDTVDVMVGGRGASGMEAEVGATGLRVVPGFVEFGERLRELETGSRTPRGEDR